MSARRCAIYARFSTDRQSETSAEDQVRDCRRRAEAEGWDVVEIYTDLAISGASNRRPGMTAMLADAAAGSFDLILAEDLDRIARDLEDVAGIYKRLRFADVGLFTLSNGAVDELQIGFKGTMDALELTKLRDKIRRGQRGCLARGRIPGGLCYGYDVVREIGPDGKLDAGRRRINPDQAAIVVRVLTEYADGRSPKAIVADLNAEGVKSARGGEWRVSAVLGNRARKIGLLHNPIYVGRFVYNRVTMKRDPESRNRVPRINSSADHEVIELPDLRIVDDALWQRVQDARQDRASRPLTDRRRPRHLFSGLVRCGLCGGGIAVRHHDRMACSRARDAGTCTNKESIRLGELQRRVLAGLETKLLSAEAVSLLVREYHLERDRQLREGGKAKRALERRLAQAEAAVARLVAAIADGGADFSDLRDALAKKTGERDLARRELSELEAPGAIALHPHIATAYRERVGRLIAAIGAGEPLSDAMRAELRGLVQAIYVRPAEGGGHEIDVVGSLESAVAMATGQPSRSKGSDRPVSLVAEEGLEPPTRGL